MPTNSYTSPYYGQQQFYQPPPQYNHYQAPFQPVAFPPTPLPASQAYSPPAEPKAAVAASQPSKNEDDFGDFKNGGSFEMEKVIGV